MKATQLYVPTSFIKSLIVGFSLALCSQAFATQTIFFFNDTAPPEIYTLSLHDALPISQCACGPVVAGR